MSLGIDWFPFEFSLEDGGAHVHFYGMTDDLYKQTAAVREVVEKSGMYFVIYKPGSSTSAMFSRSHYPAEFQVWMIHPTSENHARRVLTFPVRWRKT